MINTHLKIGRFPHISSATKKAYQDHQATSRFPRMAAFPGPNCGSVHLRRGGLVGKSATPAPNWDLIMCHPVTPKQCHI